MFNKLKSKIKSMLKGKPNDVPTATPPAETDIESVMPIAVVRADYLKQLLRFQYLHDHVGMTSYQKWHKANRRWR